MAESRVPDMSTETPMAFTGVRASRGQRAPCLTILYHPRWERIGERVRLVALSRGVGVDVSRLEPGFAHPGVSVGRPLDDRFVSRKPLRLERADDDGVRFSPPASSAPVFVDGMALSAPRTLASNAIETGVIIELAHRVVLLLHLSAGRADVEAQAQGHAGQMSETERGAEALARILGHSDAAVRLRDELRQIADLPVATLLLGESGTGKELAARAIHASGPRADAPWVCLNMATLNRNTAASELFGHVKGAFTGALRDHPGSFVRAHGGTLFLDEIGETPLDVQPMLLRALETGEIQPVGASRVARVDVRVIAATDADLDRAVAEGRFRLPLLHRLSGYDIVLPPLYQRRDDIGVLLRAFLRAELATIKRSDVFDEPERAATWLPSSVVARLCRYHWPGNIRQLRNAVRKLVIANRKSDMATIPSGLEQTLREVSESRSMPEAEHGADPVTDVTLADALRANNWEIGATAVQLGISRTWLYQLIERTPDVRTAKDIGRDELVACQEQCAGDLDAMVQRLEVSRRSLQMRMKHLGLR